jgi:hypothetical protein
MSTDNNPPYVSWEVPWMAPKYLRQMADNIITTCRATKRRRVLDNRRRRRARINRRGFA